MKLFPFLLWIVAILASAIIIAAQDKAEVKDEIVTIYDSDGRVEGQSQDNKGWHRIIGSVSLSGGEATVNLNTALTNGRQDVSFQDLFSYGGYCWTTTQSNKTNEYRVYPVSGTQFKIISSDGSDTKTIRYLVEGQ